MRRPFAATMAVAFALSLTACATEGPASMPDNTRPPFTTTTPGPIQTPGAPSGTPADVPEARWAAITTDLTTREVTGTPQLVSAEAVTWPDGSLGCPQPGAVYTQAEVPGLHVIVEVDGIRYDYRFGRTDTPRLCEP